MTHTTRKIFRRKRRGSSKNASRHKAVRQNVNVQGTDFDHLGSGAYGCVVAPANVCSSSNTVSPDSAYVAKYMTEKASAEINAYNLIKKADPNGDFTILLKESCKMDSNDNYIAQNSCGREFINNMKYNDNNGLPSYKLIIEKGEKAEFSPQSTSEEDIFRELLEMMLPIFKGLVSMKNAAIIHADIKGENMVIKNNKFKLIDYGLTTTYSTITNNVLYFENEYRYWPRDLYMLWEKQNYKRIFDESRWNINSLKNYSRVIKDKEFDLSNADISVILSDIRKTFDHCLATFDVYGLGITIYEFMVLATNLNYSTMTSSPAKELIKMMATPKVYERATPEQVLQWVNNYLGV